MNVHNKVIIQQFDDKLNRHDAHPCMLCKNYTYLSYVTCMVCRKLICTHHVTVCDCSGATVILHVRFTDEVRSLFEKEVLIFVKELNNFSAKLKAYFRKK